MIGGEAFRAALRLAVLLVLLSAVAVLSQDRSSAEFVVALMALAIGVVFLAAVVVAGRIGSARLPSDDNRRTRRYNTQHSVQDEGRRREE